MIIAEFFKLNLISFSLVDDTGRFWPDCTPSQAGGLDYGCGMFVFEKPHSK